MKISDLGQDVIDHAVEGNLTALDAMLLAVQPGIFNLAVRMLGNRDDAADATQEILLKVVTHLGTFRRQSAFTTWVFQIARNHLLTASTRSRESPEISLESIGERLQQGLSFTASLGDPLGTVRSLSPEDKLAARQVALGCTQNMLMALDREQRLVYILDVVFGLASPEAAQVLQTTPDAYRQRLARARARLNTFTAGTCGQVDRSAACRCELQVPALAQAQAASNSRTPSLTAIRQQEQAEAERQFNALIRLGDAAAVFPAHPDYEAPESITQSIRVVLRAEGFLGDDRVSH